MKKFHFWVKNAVFIKKENEFLKNSDFWYKWSYDHIQQVFQISERSDQYSRRYDILNSYHLWREKEGDLTQSYDKTPYTNRKFENQRTTHTNATKNFDYTTIADRLRTVSWSNK